MIIMTMMVVMMVIMIMTIMADDCEDKERLTLPRKNSKNLYWEDNEMES